MKYQKYISIFLLLLFIGFSTTLIKNTAVYPYGDGVEYILQSESFYNHLSPDLRSADIENYIKFNKNYKTEFYKEYVYLSIKKQLFTNEVHFLDTKNGYYIAKNGKTYCYHFWLYSLVNLPVRTILGVLNLDITYTFIITNYILLLFCLIIIFQSINLSYVNKIWTSLFLIFSPILWYLHWPHPEVFSSILVFSSLILFFDKKFYWALLLMSMSSTHFPPLFIPTLIMLIFTLKEKKITVKSLFLSFITCLFVIIPSIFYLYNYHIPNLIIEAGFIDTKYITLNRLQSFFFDVNQGMILGFPIILLFAFFLFLNNIIKQKIGSLETLFLSIFLMSYFYLQMGNWNHEMSVVNRYVVWNSMLVLFYFLFYFFEKKFKFKTLFLFSFLSIQILTCYYFINIKTVNWDSTRHNKIATWLLDNHPNWYNPDPNIFKSRTNRGSLSYTDSVIVYNRPDSTITKLMIYKGAAIKQLLARGITKEKLDAFITQHNYYQDWIYINKNNLDEMGYIQQNDTLINYIEQHSKILRRDGVKSVILNDPSYVKLLEKKAKDWNMNFEEVLEMDVTYLVEEEEKKIYTNKE